MSVLIVGAEKSPYLLDIEKKIFSAGFKTLFVVGAYEAIEKCQSEIFNVIVFDLKCMEVDKVDFLDQISIIPFAAITPLIVITKSGKVKTIPQLASVMDHTFTSDTSPELIAEYVRETVELRKKKIKKGALSQVTVPRILFDAHFFKYSGAVIFERLQEKKIIYFDKGQIVFASSNRPSERFGEYMVAQGLISMENLKMALEVSKKSSLKFGQILVEMGHISKDTLSPLVQSQIKHILFSVFDWLMGDFFLLFEQSAAAVDNAANFQVPQLISEGIRRKFNQSHIYALLNPLSRRVTLKRNWKAVIGDFPVTRAEFQLIDQVKEGSSLEEILKDSVISEIETLRVLFLLYSVNLLRFKDDGKIEGETVKKGDVLEHQAGFKEKNIQAQSYEQTDPSRESESFPSDYQTNVVEVKGIKVKKGGSFWKGFISAVIFFAVALGVFHFYVNDYYGLLNRRDMKEKVTKEMTAILTPAPLKTKTIAIVPTRTLVKTMIPTPTVTAKSTVKEITKSPNFRRHHRKGKAYYEDGDMINALASFNQAYEINRRNDELLVDMGLVYFELGKGIEAIEKYKEAIKINPKNTMAHLYLGNIYQFHGNNVLAVKEYNTYLELEPDSEHSLEVRKILKSLGGPK